MMHGLFIPLYNIAWPMGHGRLSLLYGHGSWENVAEGAPNMIRAHQDLLMLDRKEMTDDVLFDLLKMGILDWEAPNDRPNQTTPAM